MNHWSDEPLQLIEDCLNRESRLDEWEVNFLASITEQIEDGKRLSDNQDFKLLEIWERATLEG